MSLKAMAWAIEQTCGSPSAKVTLWSIANHADKDTWLAWPSQGSISKETEQSHDSVQRRIPDLERAGLVRRVPLRYSGRRSVDLYILHPSPYWAAHLDEIESLLPRRFEIDPKFRHSYVHADCVSDERGTPSAPLPHQHTQSASDATALVRQHEPVTEPVEPLRESAHARGQGSPVPASRLTLQAPDDTKVEARFQALLAAYPAGAVGKVVAARAVFFGLDEAAQTASLEALPRVRHGWKKEGRNFPFALVTYLENADWERFPKPTKADGTLAEETVKLDAFSRGAWALFARRLGGGKSVKDQLSWLRTGVTVPAAAAPSAEEEKLLPPVEVGSQEHLAWMDHCRRLGFVLPRPDIADVIFLPVKIPPRLPLRWKGYHLIEPVRVEVRSPAWWWRVYQTGAPVETLLGDRSVGAINLTMGPVPLPSEVEAMVRIDVGESQFEDWERWFDLKHGVRLLALGGSIWAPSLDPPPVFEPELVSGAPDYDALEEFADAMTGKDAA